MSTFARPSQGASREDDVVIREPQLANCTQIESAYRLACLITHPVQYFAPLFRYLSRNRVLDLSVFYMSDFSARTYYDSGFGAQIAWDVPLLEGYRHIVLPAIGPSEPLSFWRPWTRGLVAQLTAHRTEALWVFGWSHNVCLRAILAAKMLGIKVFMYGDSHLGIRRSRAVRALKWVAMPLLFRTIDAFLATATENRSFYMHYGVPSGRIFTVPYCVDQEWFRAKIEAAVPRRECLRAELGLQASRPVILYVGKLQQFKRPADLLEAYARLSPGGNREPPPYLLFIGEGEERQPLEERVRELGWASVRFLGFKNQTELPQFYDLCDVFVLTSERENLATVVIEAMNAGKSVVISDVIATGHDLVADGVNGFRVPARDVTALSNRLRLITSNPEIAARMGRQSLERISTWNFAADELGLRDALRATLGQRHT
jgi:glycosyltransferase involved in cell wall biosynthesis